ncbi:alpha/beta hydrolase [Ornithinimicrobium sp. W1679]|uniref:alpha/beta hydrolase n=1 Tax=Ornithinimicrobium sp. W1679 TaxID=3418770 RepID=UPI003CF62247
MPARQPRRTGRAGIGLLILLTLLVVVLVALWSLQRSLIYVPDTSPVPAAAQVFARGQDVVLHTEDGLELAAWLVPADEGADRDLAVLYAPGNGGNRAGRAGLAQDLSARGFTVLLLDYRGYAGNPGTPSEEGLAADSVAAARMLEAEGYPAERTIYLGESLGTGVVAALASRRPPAGLVLRSPFTELAAVGAHHYPWAPVRLLLRDRYPVVEHVQDSPVPVTVIRAARDSVVPSRLSHEVARAAGALVEEVVLEDVDHNDPAMFGPPVADAVARLADALGR